MSEAPLDTAALADEGNNVRAMPFTAKDAGGEGNLKRLTFTAASDKPYVRRAWFGAYNEVMDFKGMDQTNLKSGNMPLLDTHRNQKITDVIGRIVDYKLVPHNEMGTALEVTAEFNLDDEDHERAYRKAKAGAIRNVSVGYKEVLPNPYEITRYDDREGFNPETEIAADVRLVNWVLLEVSFVPVPADYSIGLGRAAEKCLRRAYDAAKISPKPPRNSRTDIMTDKTQTEVKAEAPEEKAAPAIETKAEAKAEPKAPAVKAEKARDIPETKAETTAEAPVKDKFIRSGAAYLAKNSPELIEKGAGKEFIKSLVDKANEGEGLAESDVKAEIFDHLSKQDSKTMQNIANGQAPAQHKSDADHNTFNFQRLAEKLIKGADLVDGREGEVIQEFTRSIDKSNAPHQLSKLHSVFVPHAAFHEDPKMRGLIDGMQTRRFDHNTAGFGHDVFKEGWITDRLTNKATCLPYVKFLPEQLAQDLVGVVLNNNFATGFVSTENATRSETTGLTVTNRKLEWALAYGRVDFSQQALDQSNYLFGTAVMKLNEDLVRRLDQEFVLGTSQGAGGFRGLLNYESVMDVSGDNGSQLMYGSLTEMIETMESANADVGNAKFVLTPKTKSWLRQIQRQAGATGGQADVIISQQVGENPQIDGKDVITSNWPGLKAQNKGTNTGNKHEWSFLVDFDDITGAYFSGMEMVVDPYSGLEQGQTRVYVRQALDIKPNHSASVVKGSFRITAN